MKEVTLYEILKTREERADLQSKLINTYKLPLICFTMNIAGPIKTSPLIERAFREGIKKLESKIKEDEIIYKYESTEHTGFLYIISVNSDAKLLKKICTDIEESSPLGRLFDMDVIDIDKQKISREKERNCLVCGKIGRTCSAGRLHSVDELQRTTTQIINNYFFKSDCTLIANTAFESLIKEVRTTPKPGLVDMRNNGSHNDMDISTFIKSARSLTPYFKKCFLLGVKSAAVSPDETFSMLRKEGVKAEQTMYNATGGINTHKGIIYSLGIICGAIGRLYRPHTPIANINEIFSLCAQMTQNAAINDFATIDSSTAGGQLFLEKGIKGIRGEVMNGFPSVAKTALPVFQKALKDGLNTNDAGVLTLLHLICNVEDTNLYHRGGKDGALFASNSAKELLKEKALPKKEEIYELDNAFIKRNLSPGGCADLLAVTYFVHLITNNK